MADQSPNFRFKSEFGGVCPGKAGGREEGRGASGGEVGEGGEHLLLLLLLHCGKVHRGGAGRRDSSVSSFWEGSTRTQEKTRSAGDEGKQGGEKEVGKPLLLFVLVLLLMLLLLLFVVDVVIDVTVVPFVVIVLLLLMLCVAADDVIWCCC